MTGSGTEAISPTAHATSYVWGRNGLSYPELVTWQGRVMFEVMRPMMTVSGLLGGPTLESYLLARHRTIDALLERAIEEEGVTQVVEIACGLSPRGLRFKRRHGEQLTYIEADLPGMAARKEAALRRMGALSETHRVVVLDALKEQGPNSLRELAGTLKPDRGLVVITEGLLGYLEMGLVQGIWGRVAETLAGFRAGRYMADIQLSGEADPWVRVFRGVLSMFVRGAVHTHFADQPAAVSALERAGFKEAAIRRAMDLAETNGVRETPGARMAHVVHAG
jgi:O-methyltransferase involved in polyketide biosynthesis